MDGFRRMGINPRSHRIGTEPRILTVELKLRNWIHDLLDGVIPSSDPGYENYLADRPIGHPE